MAGAWSELVHINSAVASTALDVLVTHGTADC